MHICHITSMHEWNDDRIYERACRMLVRLGHQVTLIATADEDRDENGVQLLSIRQRSGWKRRVFSSREAYQRALALDADIFHFHDPDLMPWMNRLAAKGRKVVMDVHENYEARFYMWGLPGFLARLGAWIFRKYELDSVKSYAGLVPVSGSVKRLFDGKERDCAIVQNVPAPENLEDMDLSFEKEEAIVVYTSGTHSNARNCMETVEAMPEVLRVFPNTIFRFVGRYEPADFKQELERRAIELKVNDNLELLDMLPWKENFKRTAQAQIGCVFYEDNPNNRVTIPNRLFEYMYCKLAVIGHDFTELRSIITESNCGVLVDSSNSKNIASKLIELIENPILLNDYGLNGHLSISRKYNFKSQCNNMVQLYERILIDK